MKKYFLLFLFFLPNFSTSNQVQNWIYISSTTGGLDYYYSPERIKFIGDNIVSWLKASPSPLNLSDYRLKLISQRKSHNLEVEGYEFYSYTLAKYKFDCKKDIWQVISSYDYNINGEVLSSSEFKHPEWSDIIPESIFEAVINYLCALK